MLIIFLVDKMVPSPEVTWNKILTRISRIHGVSLEELQNQDQEDVVAHYWRYISQQNLERLSLGADISAKVAERDKRNRRYIKMKELEQCGYFELVKVHTLLFSHSYFVRPKTVIPAYTKL